MDATIQEIATLMRATEPMAAQFVRRVQERVGQPVPPAEVLAAMRSISVKRLSLEKVVTKVQDRQKRKDRQPPTRRSKSRPPRSERSVRPSPRPKTLVGRLQAVLEKNWDQAEAEGLRPQRMSADAFIGAVYRYTDRRTASRRRILQAATQLNQDEVLLTPALVADAVHELL